MRGLFLIQSVGAIHESPVKAPSGRELAPKVTEGECKSQFTQAPFVIASQCHLPLGGRLYYGRFVNIPYANSNKYPYKKPPLCKGRWHGLSVTEGLC